MGFDGEKSFGIDQTTNEEVLLKKGPYGIYLQLGNDKKPKEDQYTQTYKC